MKIFVTFLITATLTIVTGCSGRTTTTDTEAVNKAETIVEGLTARQLVDDNTFIDVDITEINKQIAMAPGEVNPDDIARCKAVLYRFYQNVELIDSAYVCSLKNGKEINISEQTFNTMLSDMNKANEDISNARKRGEDITLSIPDDEYLNSLLN